MLHRYMFAMPLALVLGMAACGDNGGTGSTSSGSSSSSSTSGSSSSSSTSGSTGPLDVDIALKAAIVLGSCVPDDGVNRVLNRIYTRRGAPDDFDLSLHNDCLASYGGGCAALEACIGIKLQYSSMPCDTTCENEVLTFCDDGMKATVDCAKVGKTCSTEKVACMPKELPMPCDAVTYVESCKDGAPHICPGTFELMGPVCADYGLACGKSNFDSMACVGTGAMCTPSVGSSLSVNFEGGLGCNGTKLHICINGGEHDVDCGMLADGFTCQTAGIDYFCGLANECVPSSSPSSDAICEGDMVVVCNAGRIDKVDCKSLGFTSCNATFGTCGPSVYDEFPMP